MSTGWSGEEKTSERPEALRDKALSSDMFCITIDRSRKIAEI